MPHSVAKHRDLFESPTARVQKISYILLPPSAPCPYAMVGCQPSDAEQHMKRHVFICVNIGGKRRSLGKRYATFQSRLHLITTQLSQKEYGGMPYLASCVSSSRGTVVEIHLTPSSRHCRRDGYEKKAHRRAHRIQKRMARQRRAVLLVCANTSFRKTAGGGQSCDAAVSTAHRIGRFVRSAPRLELGTLKVYFKWCEMNIQHT